MALNNKNICFNVLMSSHLSDSWCWNSQGFRVHQWGMWLKSACNTVDIYAHGLLIHKFGLQNRLWNRGNRFVNRTHRFTHGSFFSLSLTKGASIVFPAQEVKSVIKNVCKPCSQICNPWPQFCSRRARFMNRAHRFVNQVHSLRYTFISQTLVFPNEWASFLTGFGWKQSCI